MKKFMILLLIFIVSFDILLSKEEWLWQNPLPSGHNLNDIYFHNEMKGWAVGVNGIIRHTIDGGATWTEQNSGVDVELWDITFLDSAVGKAVGDNGTLLITDNGGVTWSTQYTGVNYDFKSVCFVNTDNGWLAGTMGKVLHTTDGGGWWVQTTTGTIYSLYSVFFADDNVGWVAGQDGQIFHTTDGGSNWNQQNSGTSYRIESLFFRNLNLGWAVGMFGTILHTTDGGENWEAQLSFGEDNHLHDVFFITDTRGWAVGDSVIVRTTNSGAWWARRNPNDIYLMNSVHFINNNTGYVAGNNGVVIATTNSGADWDLTSSVSSRKFIKSSLQNDQNVKLLDEDGVFWKTIDGGNNWSSVRRWTGNKINSLFFINDSVGWAVGENIIMGSGDGGQNWTQQKDTTVTFNDVFFIDSAKGWAAGFEFYMGYNYGTIMKTNDGEDWDIMLSEFGIEFHSIFFINPRKGWAVGGAEGSIMCTTDGGINWAKQQSKLITSLYDVYFISESKGWAVGDFGEVIITTDGGANWNPQESDVSTLLNTVYFADENIGWAGGNNGVLIYTVDGGLSWDIWDFGNRSNIRDINMIDRNTGWAVGENGTILKYILESIVSDFEADPVAGFVPLEVEFTDKSIAQHTSITSWSWDFGDGEISTDQNPSHQYKAPGVYTVSLSVSDGANNDIEIKSDYITVTKRLDAEFLAEPLTGTVPLEVIFTDHSSGTITNWDWSFGDGETSTVQNPVHIYENPGTFSVELTVSSATMSDTETKESYIRALGLFEADFTADPVSGYAPLEVSFNDNSSGTITNWSWDFGRI